jgi:hypothetical protein
MIEAHRRGPAATLHDTAAAFRIIGMPGEAEAMQADAIEAAAVVRVAPPGAVPGHAPLRVLAVMTPGDLMANTPLEFITNHLAVRLDLMLMLVANSAVRCQAAWSAAKRETRVLATGVPANHSATRTRLMAAAVMTCWRCVLARPR